MPTASQTVRRSSRLTEQKDYAGINSGKASTGAPAVKPKRKVASKKGQSATADPKVNPKVDPKRNVSFFVSLMDENKKDKNSKTQRNKAEPSGSELNDDPSLHVEFNVYTCLPKW